MWCSGLYGPTALEGSDCAKVNCLMAVEPCCETGDTYFSITTSTSAGGGNSRRGTFSAMLTCSSSSSISLNLDSTAGVFLGVGLSSKLSSLDEFEWCDFADS